MSHFLVISFTCGTFLLCALKEQSISSCCIQKYFFNSSHITCGLDLQGKRMKRKRKLQDEGGEDDMTVGEMSFIMVV